MKTKLGLLVFVVLASFQANADFVERRCDNEDTRKMAVESALLILNTSQPETKDQEYRVIRLIESHIDVQAIRGYEVYPVQLKPKGSNWQRICYPSFRRSDCSLDLERSISVLCTGGYAP